MPSLVRNTAIYTIGRVFPQMANFVLLPIYTSYLLPDGYGIVESMLVLGMILSIFLSMASERSMFRLYYDYKSDIKKKLFIGNIFISILFSSSFISVLIFIFNNLISNIYSSIDFNPYYTYTILSSFCLSFSFIPLTLFQVQEKALKFICLNIGTFIVNTILIVFFVVYKEEGASGYLKGKMIASMLLLPVFIWIILKNSLVKFNSKIIKNILSFSMPMIPVLVMAWILNMSNRIFIEQYYSLDEVGIFSLAFKISSLSSIILGALFTAYNPVFYKIANDTNIVDVVSRLKRMNNSIIMVVFIITGMIALFARELIALVFESQYHKAGELIPVLVLSILFVQLTGLLNLMIYQRKRTYLVTIVSIIGAFISVGLNFIFVPRFGMWGAAYASVLTAFSMFVIEYIFALKAFFIPMPLFKIFSLTVSLSVIVLVSNYWKIDIIWLNLVVKFSLITLLAIIFYKTISEKIRLALKGI